MIQRKKFLLLCVLLSTLLQSAKRTSDPHFKEASTVNKQYIKQLDQFERQIQEFQEEGTKKKFLQLRNSFKTCEYLLCYVNNQLAKSINGPNIIVNEYDSLNPNEQIDPHGLQVIEYHLYQPSENSKNEIAKEIQLLKSSITQIKNRHLREQRSDFKLFNTLVWDAWRVEIMRIEALGITGFDTPACGNALPETISALQSLKKFIQLYKNSIQKKENKEFNQLINAGIEFIEQNLNFNAFDRLTFIHEYLHPLSEKINHTRAQLGFEFPSNIRPVNNEADHLFSSNILNDTYFSNSSSPERIALGKMLFNDTQLSLNNTRSCTTCHDPGKAFTDGKVKNSNFEETKELLRNTPTLINAGWQTKFFYDSRVKNLEKQAISVIHNPDEMGGDLQQVIEKIKHNENYILLFHLAYKDNINESTLVNAISVYIQSLRAFNSKIDRYFRGESELLSADEKAGFNLFTGKAKCATCHYLPLFNGLVAPYFMETESEKIGVPSKKSAPKEIDPDLGRYNYTHLELHRFAFKTPSLRMIAQTAPYMHNGVFGTLEEVVDFYNKGGGAGQGMDFPDQTLGADSLGLSKHEQQSLVAFLKSLSE